VRGVGYSSNCRLLEPRSRSAIPQDPDANSRTAAPPLARFERDPSDVTKMGFAFFRLAPVGLAPISRLAPARMLSLMLGRWLTFPGDVLGGWFGGFWGSMTKRISAQCSPPSRPRPARQFSR
jgi:hypothetical protein